MLRTIFLVLLVAVAALLVFVGLQPPTYRVERSAVINAPPGAVFAQVYDLNKWPTWSPWAKLDPEMKVTIEGPSSGPGAIMRWAGNEKVGRGAMAIVEARPTELIKTRLDFAEPMEGTSFAEFQFQPDGAGTKVTWSMNGEQGFGERLICTLLGFNLEQMIGADYERGLANLKSVAEAAPSGEVGPSAPAAEPAPQVAPTPPG